MTPQDLPPARSLAAGRKEQLRAALVREANAGGTRRTRPALGRRTRFALAASVVAGGALAWTLTATLTGSDSAYASWSAVPDPVRIGDISALAAACQQNLSGGAVGRVGSGSLKPVLAERRGDFTAVLLGNDNSAGICIDGKRNKTGGRTEVPALAAGQSLSVEGNGGDTNGPDALRYTYGRVAPSIVKVVVNTSDGKQVTATTQDGFFFAWWPSGADPAKADAFGSAGNTVTSVSPPKVPHS